MFGKKYWQDYRTEDKMDARGKRRSVSVYVGGDYAFLTPARAGKMQRGWLLGLNILSWLCFIGALVPRSLATDTYYCLLPFILSVLTLIYESAGVFMALTAHEPLKREQADRLSGRLPTAALLTLIFSAVALAGCALNALRMFPALLVGDAIFTGCAALIAAASAVILRLAQGFRTEKKV